MIENSEGTNLLWVAILVEGGLVALALLIGQVNFYDHTQPLDRLHRLDWPLAVLWGVVATLPMLGYLVLFHFWRPTFYQPMRTFAHRQLKPMFASSGIVELLIISLMAGLGEELFFRWCVQGGFISTFEPSMGRGVAIACGLLLTSFLFGVCHWVNTVYFVFAGLAGLYFGLVLLWTGSWVPAAISHALFDFCALLYLRALPQIDDAPSG